MSCYSTCSSDSLLDITGLCNISSVSDILNEHPYWYQMIVPEYLNIPDDRPGISVIDSLNVSVDIYRNEVITVPVCPIDINGDFIPNLEGKISTGRKLIIEGQICQNIVYSTDDPTLPNYSIDFYYPFSSYIVLPQTITTTDGDVDTLDINFTVNACVEDIAVTIVEPKKLLKQVTMLLYAVPNL
ncbi:hypothetical protein TPDSL_09140 [Terrisporobacter petrolearius]|uniref:SPOCS domain-containing protein n=1 Tax=Terrisporobacter petrolearius TaxID=1460447 RepID=UPI0008EBF3E4|nr:protein of unknown function [Terrisporobacter glycolicus]